MKMQDEKIKIDKQREIAMQKLKKQNEIQIQNKRQQAILD